MPDRLDTSSEDEYEQRLNAQFERNLRKRRFKPIKGPQFDPRDVPTFYDIDSGQMIFDPKYSSSEDAMYAQGGESDVNPDPEAGQRMFALPLGFSAWEEQRGFPRRVPPVPRMSTWGDYFTRLAQPDESPEDQEQALRMFQQFQEFMRAREQAGREEATISAAPPPERLQEGIDDVEHFQSGTSDAQRKQAIINKITSGHQDYTYGPGSPGATRGDVRQRTGTGDRRLTHGDVALPPGDYNLFTPAERRQYRIFDKSMINATTPTPRGSVERYYAQRGVPLPQITGGGGQGAAPRAMPRPQPALSSTPIPGVYPGASPAQFGGGWRPATRGALTGPGPRQPTGINYIETPENQLTYAPRSPINTGGMAGPSMGGFYPGGGTSGGYPPMNFGGPYSTPPYNPSGSLWTQGQTGATGPGYGSVTTPGVNPRPTPRPTATPLVVPPGSNLPRGPTAGFIGDPESYTITERSANPAPREAGASMFDQYGGPTSNYFSGFGGGSSRGTVPSSALGGLAPGASGYGTAPGAYTGVIGGPGDPGAAAGAAAALAGTGGTTRRAQAAYPTAEGGYSTQYASSDFGRGIQGGPNTTGQIGMLGSQGQGYGTLAGGHTVGNLSTAIGLGGNLGGSQPANLGSMTNPNFPVLSGQGNWVRTGYYNTVPVAQWQAQNPGQALPSQYGSGTPRPIRGGTHVAVRPQQKGTSDVNPLKIFRRFQQGSESVTEDPPYYRDSLFFTEGRPKPSPKEESRLYDPGPGVPANPATDVTGTDISAARDDWAERKGILNDYEEARKSKPGLGELDTDEVDEVLQLDPSEWSDSTKEKIGYAFKQPDDEQGHAQGTSNVGLRLFQRKQQTTNNRKKKT